MRTTSRFKNKTMMLHVEPHQELNVYDLYIYDEVTAQGKFDWKTWTRMESETSAKYFRDQLSKVPQNATINLFINSNGGEVNEGLSIYNQLKRHGATVNGTVDGACYSVAFLILQACNKRTMNLGTSAMIHNMWMNAVGNAQELREAADRLDKMMESNRQVFLEASGGKVTEEQLIEMMDAETFLTPDECLEYGFIDEVNKKADDPADPAAVAAMQQKIRDMAEQMEGLRTENEGLRQQLTDKPELTLPDPVDPEVIQQAFNNIFK